MDNLPSVVEEDASEDGLDSGLLAALATHNWAADRAVPPPAQAVPDSSQTPSSRAAPSAGLLAASSFALQRRDGGGGGPAGGSAADIGLRSTGSAPMDLGGGFNTAAVFPGFDVPLAPAAPFPAAGRQPAAAPAVRKKPGILSSLTAGPAFLKKQLQAAVGTPFPPGKDSSGKEAGGAGGAGSTGPALARRPIKHASTEPTRNLMAFFKEARQGGEVSEPLLSQLSSIVPEDPTEELFLPASAARERIPFYRQRTFWVSNSLMLAWSALFVGIGLSLFFTQDCRSCPQPVRLREVPNPDDGGPCWAYASTCPAPPVPPSTAGCACLPLDNSCVENECTETKLDDDSIGWRVLFFLACLPVTIWSSRILGALFVEAVSLIEAWAERKERQLQQRELAALLAEELQQKRRREEELREEKQRALARQQAGLGSGQLSSGQLSSGQLSSGQLSGGQLGGQLGSALPNGAAAVPPGGVKPARDGAKGAAGGGGGGVQRVPIGAPLLSWQAGLLERAAEQARREGDTSAQAPGASCAILLPPSPPKPAAAAASSAAPLLGKPASGGSGGGSSSALGAGPGSQPAGHQQAPQQAPQRYVAAERSRGGLGSVPRFILSLEASYLAEHIQLNIRRCVCLGLATGFWAIFWCFAYHGVVPDHDQRYWVFFRILLCLTLMMVVNLITRTISSLAGIKLKRLNHRQRMLEVSKREALLQLLLSRGLEDDDDPRSAVKLLPRELQPPQEDGKEQGEGAELAAGQASASWRKTSKLFTLPSTWPSLSHALPFVGLSEKRTSSLPAAGAQGGDIEQARGGGQEGEQLRRSMTDKGPQRTAGATGSGPAVLQRSGSGSGKGSALPSTPAASPKAGDSPGALGASNAPVSPSAASATHPGAALPNGGRAAGAGTGAGAGAGLSERQWVVLTSRAGDLSKANMLADRERHFLEDELRLKYWNARAEAVPGPDGVPVTGREDSTTVCTEEDATSLGRFIFHRRVMSFLRMRAQLIREAEQRREEEAHARRAKEEAEAKAAAKVAEAAAAAAAAAEGGGAGGGTGGGTGGGAGGPPAASYDRSLSAVAESIPGLIDMFGSSAEDDEVVGAAGGGPSAAAMGAGAVLGGLGAARGHAPGVATAGFAGRPMAHTASGHRFSSPGPGPFAGAAAAAAASPTAAARRQSFAASGGGGGAFGGAVVSGRRRGGAGGRSFAAGSVRREGFNKDELRYFLQARGAGNETDYAFSVLDRDFDDWVTEENAVRTVRQLYKDRHNLRKGLEGTNTILRKLDVFIGGVLHAIFIIFYLLVWGVAFTENFYNAFSALLLAFSFIFQSTIANLYENVVFIFLIHPFDVGDTLLLNATRHNVEEIHLHYTRFLDKDNGRVWWPNRVLRDTPFINLSTSEIMEDGFHLLLDLDMAARHPDLLAKVKARLDEYCWKHRGEFDTGGTEVTYRDITSPMGVLMKAEWHYSHPGTSKSRCARARTGLIIYTTRVLTELGVRYSWPNGEAPNGAPSGGGTSGAAALGPPAGPPGGGGGGSGGGLRQPGRGPGSSSSSEGQLATMHGRGPGTGGTPGGRGMPGIPGMRGSGPGSLPARQVLLAGGGGDLAGALAGSPRAVPAVPFHPRVQRTESSETLAAEVPLHELSASLIGEASPRSPAVHRQSTDSGTAGLGMPPSRPLGGSGGLAVGRGSSLARPSAATLAPTAAGRGARAGLAVGTGVEEAGAHPERMRLLPEAAVP